MTARSLLTHAACCLAGIGLTAIVLKPKGKTEAANPGNSRTVPAIRRMRNDPSQAAKHKQDADQQLLRSIPDREEYSERNKWLEEKSITAADWQKLGLTEAQVRDAVEKQPTTAIAHVKLRIRTCRRPD